MSEFFIVNPLPPEQIHHEFNIYISNIYSERETRIMARRFEVEKGEEEEEEENERFAKEGGYNQTGFNFTVERNFYWDRRSRRQPETERMDENRLESWAEKARSSRFEERRSHCP